MCHVSCIEPDELNQLLKLFQNSLDNEDQVDDLWFYKFEGISISSENDRRYFIQFIKY